MAVDPEGDDLSAEVSDSGDSPLTASHHLPVISTARCHSWHRTINGWSCANSGENREPLLQGRGSVFCDSHPAVFPLFGSCRRRGAWHLRRRGRSWRSRARHRGAREGNGDGRGREELACVSGASPAMRSASMILRSGSFGMESDARCSSGRNGWMRSKVAVQRRAWSSSRLSEGGTRKPDAFMTSSTFLSSSGTASNCICSSQSRAVRAPTRPGKERTI